ncbi:MAG TPA: ArdC-like ssDNA-binding domain-containing protein [Vicinamibacterales bacterium]|nr:ArdC-like ssDNA-binding domain-containing protein [Vicinamibacterales bacterium]
MTLATATPQFAELLSRALTEPGVVSRAYSAFHGYSVGNQILAFVQCAERGITPSPISTFVGWQQKGRHVRKGEKAITLCQPVTVKRKSGGDQHLPSDAPELVADQHPEMFTRFIYRPHWFVLSQTDGQDVEPTPIPSWDQARALDTLGIVEEPFTSTDGNCQGYARQRTIAVSPVAALPHKTRFHELAHVVLGHTSEADAGVTDSEITPRSLREVEAEAVALVCLEALGLPGAEHCRGYIQHWNAGRGAEPIPERSAQRILKAADQILKAGTTNADAAVLV